MSIFFNFFKKSPVENFAPPIAHDFFSGMSRPNIPLSEYEIKKRAKIDRSRCINWFYWKNVFFSNFRAFWPPGNEGRGVKNLKMLFLTFLYHMLAGLTIYIEIRDFCQKNHFFNGHVNARINKKINLCELYLSRTVVSFMSTRKSK